MYLNEIAFYKKMKTHVGHLKSLFWSGGSRGAGRRAQGGSCPPATPSAAHDLQM